MSIHPSLKSRLVSKSKTRTCPGQARASQRKRERRSIKREELRQAAQEKDMTIPQLVLQRYQKFRSSAKEIRISDLSFSYRYNRYREYAYREW